MGTDIISHQWRATNREALVREVKEVLRQQRFLPAARVVMEEHVLRFATVRPMMGEGEVYLALRQSDAVTGAVVVWEVNGDTLSVRSFSENEHPYRYGASVALITALSPTTHPLANEWRTICMQDKE